MGIWHALNFQSDRSAEKVLETLLGAGIGLRPAAYDQIMAEGLFGRVVSIEPAGRQMLLDDYNLRADLRLTFDETFEGDRTAALEILGKAVAFLLNLEKGNAVLFWAADAPILRRIDSRAIEVAETPEFDWLRAALSESGLTFEAVPKARFEDKI